MLAPPARSDFHLGAHQHDAGLERLLDEIVVARLAVLRRKARGCLFLGLLQSDGWRRSRRGLTCSPRLSPPRKRGPGQVTERLSWTPAFAGATG